jgi:hypothetical protein
MTLDSLVKRVFSRKTTVLTLEVLKKKQFGEAV